MYNKLLDYIEKNAILSKFVNRDSFPQFLRYLVVGFSTTTVELLLFYLLLEELSITAELSNYLIQFAFITSIGFGEKLVLNLYLANTIAYTIVFVFNYTLQRKWAFKSQQKKRQQILLYGPLFIFNLIISSKLVEFFHIDVGLPSFMAKIISIALVVSWNFVLYKKIIFKK